MIPRRLLCLIIVATAATGCASYEAKPFISRTASSILEQDNYNDYGLVFAARMPEGAEYLEKHFGFNPADYNMLPVEVFLENTSEDANFEIRVSQARFTLADGTEFAPVPLKEALDELSFSGWSSLPWWPLFIFPGFIALSDVWDANVAMEDDYSRKVLDDRNVAPKSRSVQGALLFRVVDDDRDLDEIELREASISLRVTMRSATSAGDTFTTRINFPKTYDLWAD